MSLHSPTQAVTRLNVRFRRWPGDVAVDGEVESVALHARQVFAHVVAELRVKRERTRVKASLNKSDTSEILRSSALVHSVHQTSADRTILHRRINCDRPDACDRVAFVEKIAADNAAIDLRDNAVELRMVKHPS